MALGRSRRSDKFPADIWPGFVDAMTSLLMVLMFVLTIFMVVQSVLRDRVESQSAELVSLSTQLSRLGDALALERRRTRDLSEDLDAEQEARAAQERLVASLSADLEGANGRIADFETRLAALVSERDATEVELETLRDRLRGAQDEVTAMTLALEAARAKAEETLTLLAAAEAAKADLAKRESARLSEAEKAAALRAVAEATLAKEKAASAEAQKKLALLNEQTAALRSQLAALQAVLDTSASRDVAAKVQIEALGTQLNAALAQTASEQRKRAALEEAARRKAEAEAKDLARYRSEFFGRLSQVLQGREGVRVVGDRFVFSSEVLFEPGRADLSDEGKRQIGRVAGLLSEIAGEIPPEIDWIIRVDGHTDAIPLLGTGDFRDNWELSQARALSVVRYMVDGLGFDPRRLAATGFGEYRPVAEGDSPAARAQNRRIELKLTER